MAKVEYWDILEEITRKKDWYSKIFVDDIQQKWKEEVCQKYPNCEDQYWLACRILQVSAAGVYHDKDCQWNYEHGLCEDCREMEFQKIRESGCHLLTNAELKIIGECKSLSDLQSKDVKLYDELLCDVFTDVCKHPPACCKCIPPSSELNSYIVYKPNESLSENMRRNMLRCISDMMKKIPIDWHPGSNGQVRDIIHPSLYPYVRGISQMKNGKIDPEVSESERYSWLPSDIFVDSDYNVQFKSYINNLDEDKFPQFKGMIGQVLSSLMPTFSRVLETDLTKRNLQVIVKVASTHLTKENPIFPGGSWHIEGTPSEKIIASGLHYLKVENITPSFLEFRKPVIINDEEVEYPQCDPKYTTHHYGITPGDHYDGTMNRYLGLIKCSEGATVVFPNTLQHHVKEFKLEEGSEKGERIILAFFLIDPDCRIVSTADVLPQQEWHPEKGKTFTRHEAELHRERLMYHRKFFVDELNNQVYERPFSLCEH